MKKWFILFAYLSLIIAGFIYRDALMAWIQNSDPSELPFMLFLSAFLASIPVIPFTLFGGLMGIKFGVALGFIINWFGSLTAAILYYLFTRRFLADFFKRYVEHYRGVRKFNLLIKENSFLAVLLSRMIPVIPPTVINVYSAVNNIKFSTYIIASLIGKIPPMLFLAFGGSQIFLDIHAFLLGLTIYLIFLLVIFFIYRTYFKRKIEFS